MTRSCLLLTLLGLLGCIDPEPPADLRDWDLDGYPAEEDCDDLDPSVFPGAPERCDGVDEDCDGDVDEDAVDDDPNEPNDSSETALGTLTEDDVISVSGILHADDDVDLFSFDFEDSGWSSFVLTVRLSGIPDDADYGLMLEYLDGETTVDAVEGGGALSITLEDTLVYEDGGSYRVTVDADSGADCSRSYLLSLDLE